MLKRGGIESIIVVVLLVAVVIGLIISTVLKTAGSVEIIAGEGADKIANIWE